MERRLMPNKHIGSTLDSLLKETGDLEVVNALVIKKVLVIKIQRALRRKGMTREKFMESSGTGQILMKWLHNPKYIGNVSLNTLLKISNALGINLIDLSM